MRGYISSALAVPVHVQNLVVREYCARSGIHYELAEVENLKGFDVLERVLATQPEGIVAYSLEQFDEAQLAHISCPLHFAMEGFQADADTPLLIQLKRILG